VLARDVLFLLCLKFVAVDFSEVFQFLLWVGNNGVFSGSPVGRANDGVLVSVLKGFEQPKGLVDTPTHRQVVHGNLSHDPGVVNDDETPEGVAQVLQVHTVVLGNAVQSVGDQWHVQLSNSALGPREVLPCQVGVGGIDRDGNDFGVDGSELFDAVVEGQDFRGADEGEGVGVKDHDEVLALVVGQLDIGQLALERRRGLPVWSGLLDKGLAPVKRMAAGLLLVVDPTGLIASTGRLVRPCDTDPQQEDKEG